MRKRLRKIAQLPARHRVVLLGEQPDIVAQGQKTLEQTAGLFVATEQDQVVGKPEAARQECSLPRR